MLKTDYYVSGFKAVFSHCEDIAKDQKTNIQGTI